MQIKRVPTGVRGLDELIEGGFPKGSVVLVMGGPGTGKTIFGLQFLCEGARRGERGLFLSFEETPEKLIAEAESVGLEFGRFVQGGVIEIIHLPTRRVSEILELVEKKAIEEQVQRLVVDSLSSLLVNAMELEDLYRFGIVSQSMEGRLLTLPISDEMIRRRVLQGVVMMLSRLGLTALLTYEAGSEFAVMPAFQCDGVILLKYEIIGTVVHRTIQIVKMRMTKHSEDVLPFEVSRGGLQVKPIEELYKARGV